MPVEAAAVAAPINGYSVGYALNDWRRLRQSSGYAFADYARFLNANPGWPEESKLRGGKVVVVHSMVGGDHEDTEDYRRSSAAMVSLATANVSGSDQPR